MMIVFGFGGFFCKMMAANVFSSGYNNLFANTSKPSVFTMPATSQNFNVPKTPVATSSTQWLGSANGGGTFASTPKAQLSPPINPAYKIPADFKVEPPGAMTPVPTSGTTGGGGVTNSGGPAAAPPNSTTLMDQSTAGVNQQLQQSGQDATNRTNEFYNQQTGQIETAYKPMFDWLDQQIGAAQGELAALNDSNVQGGVENYVEGQYTGQLADLSAEQQAAFRALENQRGGINTMAGIQKQSLDTQAEGQKGNIFANTTKNVNAIDAAARASMQGLNRRLGAAADSSAASVGNEALARQALKQKGEQLGIRSQQLNDLDAALTAGKLSVDQWAQGIQNEITAKQGEVDTVHQQAVSKLNTWKRDALYQAASDFQNRITALEGQKAGATLEKQNQIAQLQQEAFANIENVLRDIDAKVISNTQAADQWKIQKMSNLEDLKSQYQMAAQYSTPSAPNYQLKDVVTGTDANGKPITQTMIFDPSTGQTQPLAGYQMTSGSVLDSKRKAQNLFNSLSGTSNLGPATMSVINS